VNAKCSGSHPTNIARPLFVALHDSAPSWHRWLKSAVPHKALIAGDVSRVSPEVATGIKNC
jgi:hypothetical protein